MNEKIDVLAVMDAAHATFDNLRHERRHNDDALRQSMHWTARIEEIIKARTAVADLISAAWRAQLLLRDMADAGFGDHGPSIDLKDALDKTVGA